MKRIKWMAIAVLTAGAFALTACGGANNAAPAGNTDGGNTPSGNTTSGNETVDDNDGDNTPVEVDVAKVRDDQVKKAWSYLKTKYNKRDGWGPESKNSAYTSLILQGLVDTVVWNPTEPMIVDSVNFLLEVQEPSGAWSVLAMEDFKGQRAVYVTSIMAQLLTELNGMDAWKGKLNDNINNAVDYLKQSQVGNPDGPRPDYDDKTTGFGGWAYSKEELKDTETAAKPASNMSTTGFAIDALHKCGVSKDDPLWEKALTFLKRNQNAGEVQDEGFTAMTTTTDENGKEVPTKIKMAGSGSKDYGGAIYSEETSKADGYTANDDGSVTLFSYGSMTYNLLRSYIFAGLKKDSIPVKLAMGWIQKNYTVERVPGFRKPEQYEMGLYYYYLSMSRTLDALGEDTIEEPDRGLKHDWRKDIVTKLGSLQSADGSWVNNKNPRWEEDRELLCTAFALNALRHTQ